MNLSALTEAQLKELKDANLPTFKYAIEMEEKRRKIQITRL